MSDNTPVTISSGGESVETTVGALKLIGKKAGIVAALVTSDDMHGLVASIEVARGLLDSGDVAQARIIASVAYDQAKSGANAAVKVKASRGLVDKARRMQAEAVKIESLCLISMAETVDAAQSKGEVATRGRPKNVSDENIFTLDEVGIDRQQLHAARQLRDAVRSEPEFIERVVEARLSEGLEPSRAALKKEAGHAIGTKTATKEDRGDDLYETPIEAMRTLLALESFGLNVLEPSVGRGAILRPLEAAGYEVTISDLVDREISTQHGECQGVGDFLASIAIGGGWDIVTNPPYGVANAYAAHALREHKPRKMALLLNLNFLAGYEDDDRQFVMDENPPSRVYIFAHRLPMMHRDGWQGNKASSQMNTGWFVWERNDDGSYGDGYPRLIRVVYDNFENAEPLAPGEGGHVSPLTFREEEEDFTRTTPRKTIEERVGEELARALVWMAEQDEFTVATMRQGVAVRPSVAVAIIDECAGKGLIEGDGSYRITEAGMTALKATLSVILGGSQLLDEVEA